MLKSFFVVGLGGFFLGALCANQSQRLMSGELPLSADNYLWLVPDTFHDAVVNVKPETPQYLVARKFGVTCRLHKKAWRLVKHEGGLVLVAPVTDDFVIVTRAVKRGQFKDVVRAYLGKKMPQCAHVERLVVDTDRSGG